MYVCMYVCMYVGAFFFVIQLLSNFLTCYRDYCFSKIFSCDVL